MIIPVSGISSTNFLNNGATGLFMEGIYADIGTGSKLEIHLSPSYQLLKFPDTYNTSFSTTSTADFTFFFGQGGIDSIRAKQILAQNIKTDGWGNLTTPLGTFPSLRHSGKTFTQDSIWVHTAGQWFLYQVTNDSIWHFEWWANNKGYALLAMDSTTADSVRNISWLKTVPVIGGVHENFSASGITIYPNPTANEINFEINNTEISAIEIFDMSGRIITAMPANKNNHIVYNAEALASGSYFYRTVDASGNTLNRGKFDKVK